MRNPEQLTADARDPRLASQPKWVQNLVHDLTVQMIAGHNRVRIAEERAEKEVTEARTLLTSGPADSDTYVDLPRSYSVYEEVGAQRPLGRGTPIEFRDPGVESGDGMTVRRDDDGTLIVRSSGPLAVLPQDTHTVRIEAR